MGTITQRKSAKGVVSFRAQARLKEDGELTHSESKKFIRRESSWRNDSSVVKPR